MFATGTPTVTVELDKERTLGFTLGAMQRIQERLGKGAFTEEGAATDQMLALPVYVWACLPAADRKEISVDEVGDLIHPGNMKAVSDAIAEIFNRSNPEGAEGNAPAAGKGKQKAST